jgi:hypothetical protein
MGDHGGEYREMKWFFQVEIYHTRRERERQAKLTIDPQHQEE